MTSYSFQSIQTANSIPYCSIDAYGQNAVYVNIPNTTQDIYVLTGLHNYPTYNVLPITWPQDISQNEYQLRSMNILTYQDSFYLCASFFQPPYILDDSGNVFTGQSLLYLYSQTTSDWQPLYLSIADTSGGYYSSITSQNNTFLATYTQFIIKGVFDPTINMYVCKRQFRSNAIYYYNVFPDMSNTNIMYMVPQSNGYYWNAPTCYFWNGPMNVLSDTGRYVYGVSLWDASKNNLLKIVTDGSHNATNYTGTLIMDIMQYDLVLNQWTSTGFDIASVANSVTGIYSTVNNLYVMCNVNAIAIYDSNSMQWTTSIMSPTNDSSIYADGSFMTFSISVNCYTDASNIDHVFVLTNDSSNNGFIYVSSDNGTNWVTQNVNPYFDAWSCISCSMNGTLLLAEFSNNSQSGDPPVPSDAMLYLGVLSAN